MMTAYGLGYLAGMTDQRRANAVLHYASFREQARRDFEAYANMNEHELARALKSARTNTPGPVGDKRQAVMQYVIHYRGEYGRLPKPREIMAAVPNVSRNYIKNLLQEAR